MNETVEIPDGKVTFVLPGLGQLRLSCLDAVMFLDEAQQSLAQEQRGYHDYLRAVQEFVAHESEGTVSVNLEQAENFDHALRLQWAKKKRRQNDAMLDTLKSPSSTA